MSGTNVKNTKLYIAESWCNKHDIIIYGEGVNKNYLRIVVNFRGYIIDGQKQYKMVKIGVKAEKWWDVIASIRIHYYDKHLNDTDFQ